MNSTVDLSPGILDITAYAGDTTELIVMVTSDGVPVDLTGAAVSAQIRKTPRDPVSAAATATVADGPNGIITVVWSGASLSTVVEDLLTKWVGMYDVEVTMAGGFVWSCLRGSFTIIRDITRSV